jgi:hypothetical protein
MMDAAVDKLGAPAIPNIYHSLSMAAKTGAAGPPP